MNKEKILEKLQTEHGVENTWSMFKKKYRLSSLYNILINTTIFILTASLVLINLWAMSMLKVAPYNGNEWQWARNCFLVMAIITAITGLLTSTLSIFKFKSKTRKMKESRSLIKKEYKEYKSETGKYAEI